MNVTITITANGGLSEATCDSGDQALIDIFGEDTIEGVCNGETITSKPVPSPNQTDFAKELFTFTSTLVRAQAAAYQDGIDYDGRKEAHR